MYFQEADYKSIARIDEILARSRKVVEESMELSKRSAENRAKIEAGVDTCQSTENSFLGQKKNNSKILENSQNSENLENEEFFEENYEKALNDINLKIRNLEVKAADDEKLLESLRKRVGNLSAPEKHSENSLEYEIIQADKLILNLKETLAVGLSEENKRLKQDFENLLKKRSVEESKLTKELEEIIREKKTLELQFNNLKYLHSHSPNAKAELEQAKTELQKLEIESKATIELLEKKIHEHMSQNARLKAMISDDDKHRVNVVKVKFHEQPRQNLSLLKRIKNTDN